MSCVPAASQPGISARSAATSSERIIALTGPIAAGRDRQPLDTEPDQRHRLQRAPAHLAAHADLDAGRVASAA